MSKTYWLYGKHAVISALSNSARKITEAAFTKEALAELERAKINIKNKGFKVSHDLARISELKHAVHQGYALKVQPLDSGDISEIIFADKSKELVLALDQITDPQNVGAIIRSAVAFGVDKIIMQKANAPEETGALAKAAAGTLEQVSLFYVTNLSQALISLKQHGFWVAGLSGRGACSIANLKEYDKLVLVLGAEGVGLRRLVEQNCDILAKININANVESLNVSNAAAITLYELSKA